MRVLHLYSGNLYGGVETFLATVARLPHLVPQTTHEFVLCYGGRMEEELRAAGAKVIRFEPVRLRRPLSILRARRALKELLGQGDGYDVVICHASWNQAIFGPVVKRNGVAHVFYIHGPIQEMQWPDRWAAGIEPDLMIGVSRDTLQSGRQLYPTVPGEVLNYPTPWNMQQPADDSDGAAIRAELNTPPDAVVISQLARLDRWKGQDLLLNALAKLKDVPGWVCWLAGGVQREQEVAFQAELKASADLLGLNDRVRFIGERRDVAKVLAATDIYCQANRGPEGFSLAFMEAFSAGCPIVTTDIGGAGELIDASCGILTPPLDVDAIAAGLRRLVLDPDARRAMGRRAREKVAEQCDATRQLTKLSELLERARTIKTRRTKSSSSGS